MVEQESNNDEVFVYSREGQEVSDGVTHAIIDPAVRVIPSRAFWNRTKLVSAEFHDGVERIEGGVFNRCWSLRRVKLLGVREIGKCAFSSCVGLSRVEFGDKLETIGQGAFDFCAALRRIVIPLKDDIFPFNTRHTQSQFEYCVNLKAVDVCITGEIDRTIASLLLQSWRDEINEEIGRINQELPKTAHSDKTNAIRRWIRSVLHRIDHYKTEHNKLLEEATALLELAIWKARLDEQEDDETSEGEPQVERSGRNDRRITSGASIVIKNVLPFLQLK